MPLGKHLPTFIFVEHSQQCFPSISSNKFSKDLTTNRRSGGIMVSRCLVWQGRFRY